MTTQFEISFRQWIPSVSKVGVNGFGKESKYVPATELTAYWCEEQLLHDIIDAINPVISVPYQTITEQYLGVFSTLVYLGRPEAIRHFLALGMSDDRLPLRLDELPDEWNHELDKFIDEQWRFCPWKFTVLGSDHRQLPTEQILPIEYKRSLTTEGSSSYQAQVHEVEIDKEYCEFDQQKVVFKIYKESKNQQLYKREADVYTRLRAFRGIAITKCYGSFGYPGTNTWIIILEHAEIGSLINFFENFEAPIRSEDYKMLWERLSDLFNGLYILHNQSLTEAGPLTGIHQDIQPANILVFRRQGNSTYDVVFKLADFGLTEIVKKDEWGEGATVPTNTEGNLMYASPEAYSNSTLAREARPRLSSLADLWSIGAVFSDFLVWSIGGNGHRELYRKTRRDAIAKLPNVEDRGSCACFHNMFKRLPEVDIFHEETLKLRRTGDVFSPRMSDFILSYLMVEPKIRLLAGQANGRAKATIEDAQRSPKPQRPGTPEDIHPEKSLKKAQIRRIDRQSIKLAPQRGYTFSIGERKVTVKEVHKEIKQKTNRTSWLKREKPSQAGMNLPGMQTARNKVNARNGREQIFVIDDCESMRDHKDNVAMTARVISYTVKVSDKNGMDLYFASDSCNPQKIQHSTDIEHRITNIRIVTACCDMKKCLDDVMKEVKAQGMNPTSIYIFTDGVWDPEHDPEVDQVIYDAINHLIENGKKPQDLMFQFIQFGSDEEGYKRLKHLDHGCKMMVDGEEYDIVDTKHWEDHVPRIVIGSLDRHNDID